MSTKPSTTPAADTRREAIIDAATKLFSERGFADTGIDDIGAAVGVTGPAVYRYFKGKQDLLVAVLDRAVDSAAQLLPRVRVEATDSEDAMRRMMEAVVSVCIADRALTAIYWHEARSLPAGPRRRLERLQREMIDDFGALLQEVRPELDDSEARMAVHAASAMMRAVANRETSLDETRLHRLLVTMACAALMGGTTTDA